MIEIERDESDLNRSKINGKIVDELPEGLKERLIDLLEKFDRVSYITIGDSDQNTTLVTDEEPFTLTEFAGEDEGLTEELFLVRRLYDFWHRKEWPNSVLGCFFCGAKVKTNEIVCGKFACQQAAKDFNSMID